MSYEFRLYSEEAIDDVLSEEVNDLLKKDVEEAFWHGEPESYINYDEIDEYDCVNTNEIGIDDLILDEIYEIQRKDVEDDIWGDIIDDPEDSSGRDEMCLSR